MNTYYPLVMSTFCKYAMLYCIFDGMQFKMGLEQKVKCLNAACCNSVIFHCFVFFNHLFMLNELLFTGQNVLMITSLDYDI